MESACTCGEVWKGHPEPHVSTCPRFGVYQPGPLLFGWNLTSGGEIVRATCAWCRYTFVRRMDDTMREFAETAAQHEC